MRSQWNGDPLPGNRFRFRVRVVRAGGRGEAACERERNVSAVARPNSSQMMRSPPPVGQRWLAGVPSVSRWCLVVVLLVSRRCPVGRVGSLLAARVFGK